MLKKVVELLKSQARKKKVKISGEVEEFREIARLNRNLVVMELR